MCHRLCSLPASRSGRRAQTTSLTQSFGQTRAGDTKNRSPGSRVGTATTFVSRERRCNSGRVRWGPVLGAVLVAQWAGWSVGAFAAGPNDTPLARARAALLDEGYPVRQRCGRISIPPPGLRTRSGMLSELRDVPGCWATIERHGYSVRIVQYPSARAATTAYERLNNRSAHRTRRAALGRLMLSAYRLPDAKWTQVRRTVAVAVRP